MTAAELVETIKRVGGTLRLHGDKIRCLLPKDSTHLTELLREHKQEVIVILRAHGGAVMAFPHCPRCSSYALYRENNIGDYDCESCGLQGIPEQIARRLQ